MPNFVVLGIPKTGSRSLESMLLQRVSNYCEYHIFPFHLDRSNLSICLNNIVVFRHESKHCTEFRFDSWNTISHMPQWVTMIRKPLERFSSEFEYGRTHCKTTFHACNCSQLVKYISMPFHHNWQLAFLNGMRNNLLPCSTRYDHVSRTHLNRLWQHTIEKKRGFIGLVEHFDQSMRSIFKFLRISYPTKSTLLNHRKTTFCDKCAFSQPQARELERYHSLDSELWGRVLSILS